MQIAVILLQFSALFVEGLMCEGLCFSCFVFFLML